MKGWIFMAKTVDIESAAAHAKELASVAMAIEDAQLHGVNTAETYYGAMAILTSGLLEHSKILDLLAESFQAANVR